MHVHQILVALGSHHSLLNLFQDWSGNLKKTQRPWLAVHALVHLSVQIEVQRRALKRLLEELKEATPSTPITEQDLIWALQAVRSRAFSGPYAGSKS
jgi:hypothetical protein